MRQLLRRFGASVAAVMLGGCAGSVPIQESTVEAALPTEKSPIVVGQTDRVAMRALLGEPWVKSDYWAFDLFRLSDREREMVVIFVPLWVSSADVNLYLLVDYDASGKVAAYDKGITRGQTLWRGPTGEDATLLQAGETGFSVTPFTHAASVFVSPARRDAYLVDRTPVNQCTVLLGCKPGWQCPASLRVDGGSEQALPDSLYVLSKTAGELRIESVRPWLAPVVLPAGDHEIAVFAGKMFYAKALVRCAEGELSYGLIDEPIRLSSEMPEAFREQPMLIWRDGHWLVPAEPGR